VSKVRSYPNQKINLVQVRVEKILGSSILLGVTMLFLEAYLTNPGVRCAAFSNPLKIFF
jgi:hypothetical protein